ncbi:MAG TPA: hypothetical protein VNG51_15305 [Ktedonobacteraceae bacterium]|nr:hypothetical protein [Ktedonobacteraceae bacterium]
MASQGFQEDEALAQHTSQQHDIEELRKTPHLEVYARSSMLIGDDHLVKAIWFEGKQTKAAQERYSKIMAALESGFLNDKIEVAKSARVAPILETNLAEPHKHALEKVIASITAQRGRALVEILVLQLAVKAIAPEQDIRLHKSSRGGDGNGQRSKFSWVEGISMRRLDDTYIVPTLREKGLLRMNEYGAFMTRTFAENYPYTLFYKAEISGAKRSWLEIIDDLEEGHLHAEAALLYVLDLLWKSSEQFKRIVKEILEKIDEWIASNIQNVMNMVTHLIKLHINRSESRARLLEVAMHALLQALEDLNVDLGGYLKPLMPMRTANLKHRNFGDVEIVAGDFVIESWDAKYDNPYLSDALDVFVEKLRGKDTSELTFGYVLLPEKKEYQDMDRKIQSIVEEYGVEIQVVSFDNWVQNQAMRAIEETISEESLAIAWLHAYAESLALRREDRAPIDEPTYNWLQSLKDILVK